MAIDELGDLTTVFPKLERTTFPFRGGTFSTSLTGNRGGSGLFIQLWAKANGMPLEGVAIPVACRRGHRQMKLSAGRELPPQARCTVVIPLDLRVLIP